jgi:urate oxidase
LPSAAELRHSSVETLASCFYPPLLSPILRIYRVLSCPFFLFPQVDASAGKDKLSAKVTSGITDLLGEPFSLCFRACVHTVIVLKSTGSAFHGYVHDEYTTLPEVSDRVLSTSVDLAYTFTPLSLNAPTDAQKLAFPIPEGFLPGSVWDADNVAIRARNGTLDIFALDESASVQVRHRLLTPCCARC